MKKLFTIGDKPITFYVEPEYITNKTKTLKKKIESHGGKLLTTREPGSVKLVPKKLSDPPSNLSETTYSSEFITECISNNKLLDLGPFEFRKKLNNRKGYIAEEEEIMRKYVESHAGSSLSVKFWEDALNKGLSLSHSADSLRYHWARVMPKREKDEALQVKRLLDQSVSQAVKKVKTEKIFIPNEDEMKNVRVVVKNCSRNVLDFSEVNFKCEEEEIDEKFERLIQICCLAGNKRFTEQEVLRALLARNGKIEPTIEHFASLS